LPAQVLVFIIFCPAAMAWQFYTGHNISEINSGLVILEPDNWSRKDLMTLKSQGRKTFAWLNLTQIEENRIVPFDIREKDYILSGKYRPENKRVAVFYHQSFRRLVLGRLREYLLKGFSGVVLTKTGAYNQISNSPINRSEMWKLITFLAEDALKIIPEAEVIIHDGESFWSEIQKSSLISGVLVEGVFYGPRGRQIKPWEREKKLNSIKRLLESGKRVFIAEDARTEKRQKHVRNEAARLNLLAEFVNLPLMIEERKK